MKYEWVISFPECAQDLIIIYLTQTNCNTNRKADINCANRTVLSFLHSLLLSSNLVVLVLLLLFFFFLHH